MTTASQKFSRGSVKPAPRRKSSTSSTSGVHDMPWLHYLSWFFGGAFLTNVIPHFVSGVMGRAVQSPFAKPSGEGLSSATVNVLWGFLNLVAGYVLVCRVGDFDLHSTVDVAVLGLGALLLALMMARHFGRFHGGRSEEHTSELQSRRDLVCRLL